MGSSTRNIPRYTKVSPAKLKFLAIEGLTILRPLIKKSHELSIGIMGFLKFQDTIFLPIMTIFMILHHFGIVTCFYNYKR